VSTAQILLLGAVAGSTIFIGLPIGRVRNCSMALKVTLSATATGILLFLLYDVLANGVAPVDASLKAAVNDGGSWADFVGLAALLALGFGVGLLSLVYYDRWMARERAKSLLGPGAASAAEFEPSWIHGMSSASWLAVLIATGIGLHNFAEGLAIGQSAALGETSLALVLIIGFALHNGTEGFGIVAPLAGDSERPTWRFLLLLGVIGGAPTFFGTLVGQAWTSTAVSVCFLALAAGSILYVVMQLIQVNARLGHKTLVAWGMFGGLVLGFATDFLLSAVGS
jgi:zinc transporter, ZIP family